MSRLSVWFFLSVGSSIGVMTGASLVTFLDIVGISGNSHPALDRMRSTGRAHLMNFASISIRPAGLILGPVLLYITPWTLDGWCIALGVLIIFESVVWKGPTS